MNKKIIIILVGALVLIGISFLVYSWWQTREELTRQAKKIEDFTSQLNEIKEQPAFVQCQEIKQVSPKDILDIILLDAHTPDWSRHMWNLLAIHPEGYGVGGYGFPLEAVRMGVHTPGDMDGNGTIDEYIYIGERKTGDYLLIVAFGDDVVSTDTYSLQINNIVLAKNVSFSKNLFNRLYILRQTETGVIPIVPASVGCQS